MRTLPAVYSQRDPRWGALHLGDGSAGASSTIHNFGCYVSCFAMVASYYGHALTPAELNARLATERRFLMGNLVADGTLSATLPEYRHAQTLDYRTVPADLTKLRELLADPAVSVILEVDFNHNPVDGTQSHFVVAVGCDGERVTIADPWTGRVEDLSVSYGLNARQVIQKFVVYGGPAPVAPTSTEGGEEAEVTLTEGEREALELIRALSWNRASIEGAIGKLGRAAEIGRTIQATKRVPKAVKPLAAELAALAN